MQVCARRSQPSRESQPNRNEYERCGRQEAQYRNKRGRMALEARRMCAHGAEGHSVYIGIGEWSVKRVVLLAWAVNGMALHGAQPHPLMDDYNRAWQLAGQARPYEAIPLLKQIIAKDRTFQLA